nr:hypothetical protein HK105_000340 [Polyrhizophydium stewartii]
MGRCRDIADMLERLPSELDAEIVKRAGPLTLLLLGRLPMPLERETLVLLWCKCLIANDFDSYSYLCTIFAQSESMAQKLSGMGYRTALIKQRLANNFQDLVKYIPAQSLDVHNAVIANNIELLEIVATSVTAASFSSGVKTAVRYNYGEIAARSIELWRQHGAQDIDVARLLIREGKVEMLRAMDKPELLRSSGIRDSICYAASHGYLAVIKFVFETTGDVTWLNDALYGAFKGGFVDVAQWLIHGPAKNVSDDILWHAALNGVASTFIMLMQERPGVEPRVLMDAAVAYNNMELLRRMNALGYRCTPNAVLMFTPHCRYYPHPFEFGQ